MLIYIPLAVLPPERYRGGVEVLLLNQIANSEFAQRLESVALVFVSFFANESADSLFMSFCIKLNQK